MSSPKTEYIYAAVCTRVIDGDTFDMAVDVGFRLLTHTRFRLNRWDTPELNSRDEDERSRAKEATEFVRTRILNQQVQITSYKADSFGRWLADVRYWDGEAWVDLGLMLADSGLAEEYKR